MMHPRILARLLPLGVLVVAALFPAQAHALPRLHTLDTPNPEGGAYGYFGYSVAVGDVDGDGKDDVAVGAHCEDVGGISDRGRAYVFSGASGSLLFTLDTPNPQVWTGFGSSVAVGDVNGDGKADVAVGAPFENVGTNGDQGRAYVFSGADGSWLFTLDNPNPQASAWFGYDVAIGDVSGDGNADIAVGAPLANGIRQGRAYVFSGASGSLLFTLDTPNPQVSAHFGYSVAVGDVNGDGNADVAVGAAYEDVGGNGDQGRAYVFSGADGSWLFTLDTPNPQASAQFGYDAAIGYVNGDGNADIAVGAHGEDVGGNNAQGRAYVFSGASGSLLFALDSPNPQVSADFGYSVAIGDVDGDGKDDITVGAQYQDVGGNNDQGQAYVFSGASGSWLFTLDTPSPQVSAVFGVSVAVGDVNGDGKDDIAVGAPRADVAGIIEKGQAYVFAGGPPDADADDVPDAVDNCPLVYNPDQLNTDGQRRPNGAQVDGEWASNPAKELTAVGDACDPDDDNDGLPDSQEFDNQCPYRLVGDSDGDRSLDGYEVAMGYNACSAASKPVCSGSLDNDGDGFTDCLEHKGYNTCASADDAAPGWTACADPADSDSDACADWIEIVDVNGSRQAEILDVLLVARRMFDLIPASDSDAVLDMDKSGAVNLLDGLLAAKNSTLVKSHNPCTPEG